MQRIPTSMMKGNSGLHDSAYTNVGGTPVMFVAHRNGPNILPEHTLDGYRSIVAAGAKAIEQDVYLLADGSEIIMHDDTIDRTTSGTGNTADQTALSIAALSNDNGGSLGGIYSSKTYPVPTFERVVQEFGGKVLLVPEGKNNGAVAKIVQILQKYNVPTDAAIVQSYSVLELAPAIAAGYKTMALGNAIDVAAAASAGVTWICASSSAPQAYFTTILAAGLKAGVYTINTHNQRDSFMAWGATMFFSNDPVYMSGTGYRLTTDPFGSQAFYHGHLESFARRGVFASGDRWGFNDSDDDRQFVLQGWGSPVGGDKNNNSYTINFKVNFATIPASRWASIFVCSNSDTPFLDDVAGANGYHCLLRQNGTLDIYSITNGVSTSIGTVAGTALATSTEYNMTVTITSTTITWRNNTQGVQASATNNTYRGGYFTFGRRGCQPYFYDVTVTDT